jgi:hypothetical protein
MLVTVYYPFSDERVLFPGRANLVQSRFFKLSEPHPFYRNLGEIIDRPKGGFLGWIGESSICSVRRSIEIQSDQWHDESRFGVRPGIAFKRLFFDGLHGGYFSIGVSISDRSANGIIERAELGGFLSALSTVPARSVHRSLSHYSLANFSQLALDLYASGSVRKLTDLASGSYRKNIYFANPIIVVSTVNSPGALAGSFARRLKLDFRSPSQGIVNGQETFGGLIKWSENTFVFAISSPSTAEAANSRFLRAGVARLYLEAYSLERMITLLQSKSFEECDEEGRSMVGSSVNKSLRRLHGAEKPNISDTRESYDALVATFARIFRPGHVADLENVLTRLQARPNLRRALGRSLLVDGESSIKAINYVEVVMGNKEIQSGGVQIRGDVNTEGGDFVGRDKITNVAFHEEINKIMEPIASAIAGAPKERAAEASRQLEELKAEAAKGKGANDSVMAKLVEGLVGLVPSAIAAITSAFATPVLGAIAGPVTKYVIERFQGK